MDIIYAHHLHTIRTVYIPIIPQISPDTSFTRRFTKEILGFSARDAPDADPTQSQHAAPRCELSSRPGPEKDGAKKCAEQCGFRGVLRADLDGI